MHPLRMDSQMSFATIFGRQPALSDVSENAVTLCSIRPQLTRGTHRRGTPPLDTMASSHCHREHHRWACHSRAEDMHCRQSLTKL